MGSLCLLLWPHLPIIVHPPQGPEGMEVPWQVSESRGDTARTSYKQDPLGRPCCQGLTLGPWMWSYPGPEEAALWRQNHGHVVLGPLHVSADEKETSPRGCLFTEWDVRPT